MSEFRLAHIQMLFHNVVFKAQYYEKDITMTNVRLT
jgi:hypothetical protein